MDHEQALTVLKDLITRIDTQDERATAKPFLHLLRVRRRQFVPHSWGDGGWWREVDSDSDSPWIKAATEAEAVNAFKAKYDWDEVGELEQFDAIEWWETQNVFLSEDGFKRHMAMNSHNYRGESHEVQDFMIYAYRNPEIYEVMQAIRTIVKEASPDPGYEFLEQTMAMCSLKDPVVSLAKASVWAGHTSLMAAAAAVINALVAEKVDLSAKLVDLHRRCTCNPSSE